MSVLIYHPDTGLEEVRKMPSAIPAGTYVGFSTSSRVGRPLFWGLRIKRRTSGHKWKQVTLAELPKRLKVEALIMDIQL